MSFKCILIFRNGTFQKRNSNVINLQEFDLDCPKCLTEILFSKYMIFFQIFWEFSSSVRTYAIGDVFLTAKHLYKTPKTLIYLTYVSTSGMQQCKYIKNAVM